MSRSIILTAAIAAILASMNSFATGDKPNAGPTTSSQKQGQGQQQGQAQYQKANAAAVSVSKSSQTLTNNSSVSTEDINNVNNANTNTNSGNAANNGNQGNTLSVTSSYRDRLQAPNVLAPSIYSSAVCYSGHSFGLSVPGGGVSGGKSVEDPNCQRREDARILSEMGFKALALKVMCKSKYVAEVASEEDCKYIETQAETYTAPATIPPVVEQKFAEQDEKIERVFRQTQAK